MSATNWKSVSILTDCIHLRSRTSSAISLCKKEVGMRAAVDCQTIITCAITISLVTSPVYLVAGCRITSTAKPVSSDTVDMFLQVSQRLQFLYLMALDL